MKSYFLILTTLTSHQVRLLRPHSIINNHPPSLSPLLPFHNNIISPRKRFRFSLFIVHACT
ncbi:hypothetical protein GBAR_LOCUS12933, partial [Geodia barretti]